MAWTHNQAREFAKQIKSDSGAAWWTFVDDIREAILDAKVMSVVLGQDGDDLTVSEIRKLRIDVATAMLGLKLSTPTGESYQCARREAERSK